MKFNLVNGKAAGIFVDPSSEDYSGILHVAKIFTDDVRCVTDVPMNVDDSLTTEQQIVVGTLGKSQIISQMEADGALDVSAIRGKRECFLIQLVTYKETEKLVVVGTETVATLHGIYSISEKIGVSPWVYWADVNPAKKKELIFDESINFVSKEPSVKFRGFFMNDEWPSLGKFVENTFGDFNEFFYEKVFDLLLRLKGNYFWPAMWSASLPLDGSEDPLAILKLGTKLGITIGQSHHEPLTRASEEWDKVKTNENNVGYGKDWNYYTNGEGLYRYWEDGLERDKDFKHMITIGMRGERDTMMLGENSSIQENVELLRKIITDQKKIISDKNCDQMPKMLALYKEVEGFYYGGDGVKGLKSWDGLDDVTLLLSDDNFGNVRTLPTPELKDRKAGWGLYYHFDYHGAPISYEWINSTPLQKVWEQVSMAYDYGIKDLWIVNVGDIRPDELPLSYFMALAYDFEGMGTNHINATDEFLAGWVEEQFGAHISDENVKAEIASVLKEYTRIHGLRRPEAMNPKVYDVAQFNETKEMINRCEAVIKFTNDLNGRIPKESEDAFFGLVYYPAVAGMNIQLMSLYASLNNWYAMQGISAADVYEKKVQEAIELDKKLMSYYNEKMAGGKWNGMMLSAHACFETWNDEGWHFPETKSASLITESKMLVHAENDSCFVAHGQISLPEFTSLGGEHYSIEIANAGETPFDFEIAADKRIEVSVTEGRVDKNVAVVDVFVSPYTKESFEGIVKVNGVGNSVDVCVKYTVSKTLDKGTFIERDGIVSMEAEHFAENTSFDGYEFKVLKEYGKTLSSVKVYPTDRNFDQIGEAPCLTYTVYVEEEGEYNLQVTTAPVNNLIDGRTMRYAVDVQENSDIQVGDTIPAEGYSIGGGRWTPESWSMGVLNNCHYGMTVHKLQAGINHIKFYGVDAGFVLQKLVLYRGVLPTSYLGPKESPRA